MGSNERRSLHLLSKQARDPKLYSGFVAVIKLNVSPPEKASGSDRRRDLEKDRGAEGEVSASSLLLTTVAIRHH